MPAATERSTGVHARFALMKFRPPTLPATLVTRPALQGRLTAGADKRLTTVVGPAGAGKSVLLADWVAARPHGTTSWLTCDGADADPARFWAAFIEAPRVIEPRFGADAADLLATDRVMSADVIASIANSALKLPAGSAIIIDDFHCAAAAAAKNMADLVECWPAETAQLVLASRFDPPLRLHRLRVAGELCDVRGRDLNFSLAESHGLFGKFGVEISPADLKLLHRRSEGWAAALQMAALSLRGTTDPARVAQTLEVRNHAIAEYFIAEVLDQQPAEVAQFMLEVSILGELNADACAAVTGRQDAAALLRRIDTAHLLLVASDDEQTSYRYHHLVRQMLHAELCARDGGRERALHLRAAEWFESTGDSRLAARHLLAAQQVDRALALMQDRVMTDFLLDPAAPAPLDLSMVDPSLLVDAPDHLLALAAHLLLSGDVARGGQYLDLLEHAQSSIPSKSRLAARIAAMRAFRYALVGEADKAVNEALAARAIQAQRQLSDEWSAAVPLILLRVYTFLEDVRAVAREAATALAMPALTEPAKLVMVPGALAQAWFECGHLSKAADASRSADADARRLGFEQHFFAIDHLRVLAGLALERRDLDTAEHLAEQALSITKQHGPVFEFLALLDRAQIWAARGQVRDALATVEAARQILARTRSVLLSRADETEAMIRLSLGDLRSPAELARGLPAARRALLFAKIALAAGDHHAAQEHLQAPSLGDVTPRRALVRQTLLAAAAIQRGDPMAMGILGDALHTARHEGFLNTIVTTAPQVTSYLIEHAAQLRPDPFTEQLTALALQVRATQPRTYQPGHVLAEPLTAAELRILELLPGSTYLQMAEILYISRNTVKTHLRSIYQKLGVTSRSQALDRAVELRLI